MAIWPDVPLTTYIANNLPAIKAADLNAIQQAITWLWGALGGTTYNIFDEEFAQDVVATNVAGRIGQFSFPAMTNAQYLSAGGASDVNYDGTMGIIRIANSGGSAPVIPVIKAGSCQINYSSAGPRDFRMSCRLRVPDKTRLAASGGLQFGNIVGSMNLGFEIRSGDTNWQVIKIDGTTTDAGSSGLYSGNMTLFEIRRSSGTISYLINGTQVFSETPPGASLIYQPGFTISAVATTDGNAYVEIDNFKLAYSR